MSLLRGREPWSTFWMKMKMRFQMENNYVVYNIIDNCTIFCLIYQNVYFLLYYILCNGVGHFIFNYFFWRN